MFDLLDFPNVPHAPNAVVGLRGGTRLAFSDLLLRVRAWRALLQTAPGQKFALYFNDSIEFGAALFGAWHAGKTIYLASDTLPATCRALQREVDGFLGEFPEAYAPRSAAAGYPAGEGDGWNRLDPEFVGLVVYTSGSTGTAQAIPKRLRQLAAEVATLEGLFGAELGDADIVATVSHQHIYGLLFKVLWPLAAARAVHARSYSYPEELAAATTQCDCALVTSPAHLKRLPDSETWTAAAHRVRVAFSSGGPLPTDVACLTEKLLGRAPIEVYGSSETGGIAWRRRSDRTDQAWTALPGVAWRIDRETGVLGVHSPHLAENDWYLTSDRAESVDSMRFLLHGRVDRIVKVEEKRISLDMIEAQLKTSSLVADSRVLLVDGEESRRLKLAAFVVLSAEGKKKLADEGKLALNNRLRETVAQSVERVALPRSWHFLEALPVNAQGKTTYAELVALLGAENPIADLNLPQWRLLENETDHVVLELIAPDDLIYFDGHFPGRPILPGVAQVEWAIAFGRRHFGLPAAFQGMRTLKFQQVIRPNTPFSLELRFDSAKSALAFRYFSSGGQHASGRILFGDADV